jgi:hypothetical protein
MTSRPKFGAAEVPWPIPERPVRLEVCESGRSVFSVVLALEAWDKEDPRAVAAFRCEQHVKGRAFPDLLLLERVPLKDLTKRRAGQHLLRLKSVLLKRCSSEESSVEACSGHSHERVNKVRSLAFSGRSNGRANSRLRGDVGLESASGDEGAARRRFSETSKQTEVLQPAGFTLDIGRDGDEVHFGLRRACTGGVRRWR